MRDSVFNILEKEITLDDFVRTYIRLFLMEMWAIWGAQEACRQSAFNVLEKGSKLGDFVRTYLKIKYKPYYMVKLLLIRFAHVTMAPTL